MIKVHGVSLSPFARKVLFGLEYKEITYEQIPVFPGDDSEAFSAISPLNKVPVLEDDGFTVPDSSIILRYLEARFPDKPLYPEDPQQQATACFLEEYADTKLMECCAGLFREKFLNPNLFQKPTDEDAVSTILDDTFPPVLAYLESSAQEDGFFNYEHLTVADIGITSAFMASSYADYQVDADAYPKLAGYLERAFGSALVKARFKQEQDWLASMNP